MKVRNCCLCIPLRAGLLIWGYLAVIIIYLNILYILYQLQGLWTSEPPFDSNQFIYKTVSLLLIALYFLFHVVLISGLHNRSSGLLSVYKGVLSLTMIFEGIIASLYIPLSMYQIYQQGVTILENTTLFTMLMSFLFYTSVTVVVTFMLQIYLLICVRSMKRTFETEEDRESEPFAENPDVTVNTRRNYNSDA